MTSPSWAKKGWLRENRSQPSMFSTQQVMYTFRIGARVQVELLWTMLINCLQKSSLWRGFDPESPRIYLVNAVLHRWNRTWAHYNKVERVPSTVSVNSLRLSLSNSLLHTWLFSTHSGCSIIPLTSQFIQRQSESFQGIHNWQWLISLALTLSSFTNVINSSRISHFSSTKRRH